MNISDVSAIINFLKLNDIMILSNSFVSSMILAFVTLFPLVNPFGSIPIFLTLSSGFDRQHTKQQIKRITINVIMILIVFFFVGQLLLEFFGINIYVLQIAGGLVVAHTAWQMVTSQEKLSTDETSESANKTDISFTPMALPILSGPGSIGVVIGLSTQKMSAMTYAGSTLGILLIGLSVFIVLSLSVNLYRIIGKTGVGVINRIMGFFILAIAVQLITEGIKAVLKI